MRLVLFRARVLISAWFALVLLWPLQAAAMGVGREMTVACQMMPALQVSGHMSRGGRHGMGACHKLQCHHRLGPRTVNAHWVPPVMASVMAVFLPFEPTLRSASRAPQGIRGPPLYLRLSRLLI